MKETKGRQQDPVKERVKGGGKCVIESENKKRSKRDTMKEG